MALEAHTFCKTDVIDRALKSKFDYDCFRKGCIQCGENSAKNSTWGTEIIYLRGTY